MSGQIRDFALRFSEGRLSDWILLMAADRVDVVEQLFLDLAQGHVPYIPKEMGSAPSSNTIGRAS